VHFRGAGFGSSLLFALLFRGAGCGLALRDLSGGVLHFQALRMADRGAFGDAPKPAAGRASWNEGLRGGAQAAQFGQTEVPDADDSLGDEDIDSWTGNKVPELSSQKYARHKPTNPPLKAGFLGPTSPSKPGGSPFKLHPQSPRPGASPQKRSLQSPGAPGADGAESPGAREKGNASGDSAGPGDSDAGFEWGELEKQMQDMQLAEGGGGAGGGGGGGGGGALDDDYDDGTGRARPLRAVRR